MVMITSRGEGKRWCKNHLKCSCRNYGGEKLASRIFLLLALLPADTELETKVRLLRLLLRQGDGYAHGSSMRSASYISMRIIPSSVQSSGLS